MIARDAETSPSAINYEFSGIERLFGSVFEMAMADMEAWRADREAEAEYFPPTPDGATQFLEGLILEWAAGARDLALLYQELLAAPAPFAGQAREAVTAWGAFFETVAARFQLEPGSAAFLHLMFEAEALYALSRWRPLLERAALGELLGHFGAIWLGAKPRPRGRALSAAESSVRVGDSIAASAQAQALMAAAMAVVAEHGLAGLTHRAVAARCGMTAGAAAHYFRTADDLVLAALLGQISAIRAEALRESWMDAAQSLGDLANILASQELFEAADLIVRGRHQLFLATVRDPARAAAGATVRFSRGTNVAGVLRGCMGADIDLRLHASVLSGLLSAATILARGHQRSDGVGSAPARAVVDRFVSKVSR